MTDLEARAFFFCLTDACVLQPGGDVDEIDSSMMDFRTHEIDDTQNSTKDTFFPLSALGK